MNEQTALTTDISGIKALVLDGLTSQHSRDAYDRALTDFLTWYTWQGKPGMTKALVQRYKAELQSKTTNHGTPLSASTVNQRMSAIRKLAVEAADNGLIDPALAAGIARVAGVKAAGVRAGNWLSHEQAQAMLDAPNTATLKGLRDRAILAVMIGGGLRRSEVTTLTVEHVQQRDGRWAIVDLIGKGGRVRTVPIPSWCKSAIDEWTQTAAITSGILFRAIHKGDYVNGATMSDQAVLDVVMEYGAALGLNVAAHDLRRSFAKLARKGGSELTQIQLSLGHASVTTTQRYVGEDQDLTDAPCDRLGLRL